MLLNASWDLMSFLPSAKYTEREKRGHEKWILFVVVRRDFDSPNTCVQTETQVVTLFVVRFAAHDTPVPYLTVLSCSPINVR